MRVYTPASLSMDKIKSEKPFPAGEPWSNRIIKEFNLPTAKIAGLAIYYDARKTLQASCTKRALIYYSRNLIHHSADCVKWTSGCACLYTVFSSIEIYTYRRVHINYSVHGDEVCLCVIICVMQCPFFNVWSTHLIGNNVSYIYIHKYCCEVEVNNAIRDLKQITLNLLHTFMKII